MSQEGIGVTNKWSTSW